MMKTDRLLPFLRQINTKHWWRNGGDKEPVTPPINKMNDRKLDYEKVIIKELSVRKYSI